MERYSLIVVTDETAPIRRFDVRKDLVRRAAAAAAIAACVFLIGLVDYVRVRIDHAELEGLRIETAAQRAQIDGFASTLAEVETDLDRLRNFERKVRIIANLPGSVAVGGEEVTAVEASAGGDLEAAAQGEPAIDVGGPAAEGEEVGDSPDSARSEAPKAAAEPVAEEAAAPTPAERASVLRLDAERLGLIADARATSLADLLEKLEGKRHYLASTPSIWPTKGWLTSRFGNRVSPFTGGRQFHAGIDIAGRRGTDVIATARGRVVFSGTKGHMGKSLIIDHGYGIRTHFGHNDEVFVKRGEEIQRGQVVASLGSSGRSTGPHLHYVVEVKGKAVNPLDYIFD